MKCIMDFRPSVPASEFGQRWRKVHRMMAENRLDMLVAYPDDHATFGPAHGRWLANIPLYFEPMCIVIPAAGQPVLLTGLEGDECARLIGRIQDVRVLREFTHPDEDYPYSKIQGLGEIAAEIIGGEEAPAGLGWPGGA
jgi:hypothetical protein